MNNQLTTQTAESQLAHLSEFKTINDFREAMQNFLTRLNKEPVQESITNTPDGRGKSILISHIEMSLDESFFGLWETENFKWAVIANEIVGSIDLIITNPVTMQRYRRVGAASVQIMVDKRPEGASASAWANNPDNKKPNALDMGFPKLKTECLKNAANSLGALFGRDLNRKEKDVYKPIIKVDRAAKEKERMMHLIDDCVSEKQMEDLLASVPQELVEYYNNKMQSLKIKTA